MTQEIRTLMKNSFNERDLLRASQTLKKFQNWCIFAHRKADGDACGSVSALYSAGLNLGKNVNWFGADSYLPMGYKFLAHTDKYIKRENLSFNEPETLYIFLDCANETRPEINGFDLDKNFNALNIDHHEDNSLYARVNCVDGRASSTCEMLYRIFKADNWEITREIAESLYTGLYTDTGGFIYSNTGTKSHLMAADLLSLGVDPARMSDLIMQNKTRSGFALWARAFARIRILHEIFAVTYLTGDDFRDTGAELTETEGLPASLMALSEIKFAVLVHENLRGEVRASFRSREGSPFCAGEIARLFGGGGHERAAGASISGTLSEIVKRVENFLTSKYHECSSTD